MADITADCTFKFGIVGDLKYISIIIPSTANQNDTIDLGSDTAAGAKTKTILATLLQTLNGTDKTATWTPGTGIIILTGISSAAHNMFVVAKGT